MGKSFIMVGVENNPPPLFFPLYVWWLNKKWYLCSMEKLINKFLDNYLGDEVVCIKGGETKNYDCYSLFSKKNRAVIMLFQVRRKDGSTVMFRGRDLTDFVSNFFSMESNDASSVIKNWFGDKHDIKKVSDLMKFVK